MYNTISLDGSIRDFELDVGLHYEVAGKVHADAHLIGSETARTGVELFTEKVPAEIAEDFVKPAVKANDKRPAWVLVDSKGKLKGLLHVYRRSCYCKGVIVLVSNKTPQDYIDYLKERNYDYIVTGDEQVEYREALNQLYDLHGARTVLTDSGGVLSGILMKEGLVGEISLLVAPVVVGKQATNLFRTLDGTVNLEFVRSEVVRNGHMLVVYRVVEYSAVVHKAVPEKTGSTGESGISH
jgi:2,5-diamino-6-(ribosylamino)-4(3H)-pyrimidinone 5'-phosphate reductase